jgi:hypothetical protein
MGLLTGSIVGYIYFDDIKTNSISLWEWFKSFRSGGTGNNGNEGSETNNAGSNTSNNNSRNIPTNTTDSRSVTPDIQMINQKARLTSPSLETLNAQAEESWSISPPTDSSSPSSSKTITPKGKNKFLEAISSDESQLSTPVSSDNIAAIASKIAHEWKSNLTGDLKTKIEFIENTIENHNDVEIKKTYERYMNQIKSRDIVMKSGENESDNLVYKTLYQERLKNWISDIEKHVKK